MPELPEIEHLKRSLEPLLIGAEAVSVRLNRRDICVPFRAGSRSTANTRVHSAELLAGTIITELIRHGKNLALVSDAGRAVCVHLGMSGQMLFVRAGGRLPETNHVHCEWQIKSRLDAGRLVFRDPRRFGGLWTFPSVQIMREVRWSSLGPDALTIDATDLFTRLRVTLRPIKAALLDQSVLAGVGNIYADESLFKARIDPRSIACSIPRQRIEQLAVAIRSVLLAAVNAGGSTIRSYVDANGQSGNYASVHLIYGRGGEPCSVCRQPLVQATLAQRTTVFCPRCQKLYSQNQARRNRAMSELSTSHTQAKNPKVRSARTRSKAVGH